MRKLIAATAIGAGVVLAVSACGNDSSDNSTSTSMTPTMTSSTGHTTETSKSASSSTSVSSTSQLGTVDQAKLAAFVVAFRTGYSQLSEDRDDASIEKIVLTSCNDLANGADQQQVTANIRTLAANKGTDVSQDQAERIYDMVTPACP